MCAFGLSKSEQIYIDGPNTSQLSTISVNLFIFMIQGKTKRHLLLIYS